MASLNDFITSVKRPSVWNAAHKPIIYEGMPQGSAQISAVNDNSDNAQFTITAPFVFALEVGQVVYTGAVGYVGFHTIKSIQSTTQFTVETQYVAGIPGVQVIIYLPILEFELFAGYKGTEEYPSQLPLTQVATFKVEPNLKNFRYKFDVSGYLQSIFTIVPPSAGIDFNLFNRFRLYFNNLELENYQVANSAVDNPEFNQLYANTGQPLNNDSTIYFNCGETINSVIEGLIVRTYINDGCIVEGFESNDFDNNDFIINICNT